MSYTVTEIDGAPASDGRLPVIPKDSDGDIPLRVQSMELVSVIKELQTEMRALNLMMAEMNGIELESILEDAKEQVTL